MIFYGFPSRDISRAIKLTWIMDYIEQIARWAMGDPEETVMFIRECLNFDELLPAPVEETPGPPVLKIS